ncbi:MAG: DinB family protein [Bacteroidota bacterium]|nr:DinB family protein [Bacteroidota bacterium]
MLLRHPIQNVFVQLSESLNQLSEPEYTQPSTILFNATIGQHVRHIIELFLCLENGYESGIVNYEKRKRDYRIETDKIFAAGLLKDIYHRLNRPNKDIVLEAEDYGDTAEIVSIPSNYYREIAYNLEHTIHHMALIRVGITEVSSITLPNEFGVAYSTIKFRQQCAQ